jgi:predicted Zn finger-like uncharacterized protein
MKIICDSCGTKYSISDDKVRGKVFKIRCKKCSHIIVVRGGEAAADAAAVTPPIEGGWHIVVDGEQVGPIPEADVRSRIERGEIKADTYTWKEGFTDWVKLSAVPEFADLLTPATTSPAAGELFTAPAASNGAEHSHRASAPRASLFGNGTAGEDVFSAPSAAPRSSGGDLFSAATGTASSEPRWPTSGAAASGHDGGRVESLTGQRHENSVLFSLANLQSLASANAPKAAPSVGLGAPAPEGSGLIDIRAMAASTLSSPAEGANGTHSEDLPAFGSFSPAAPVLLPIQASTPKWVYPAVGIMVALVGAIGFVGYKVATAKSPLEPTQVLVPVPTPAPAPAEPAKTAAKAPSEGKPSTIPDDKLPPRSDEGGAKAGGETKAEKSEHHHKAAKEKKVASADEKKASAPAPAETEKRPAKGTIDALLLDAVPKGSRAARGGDDESSKKSSGEGAAPLAKNAVVAGMNSVKGKVNDCYNQFKVPGMAMVNVVIGKNGKISSATVTGKFAGTPTGACVERAVKSANFPPSSDGLSTPYPFNLK